MDNVNSVAENSKNETNIIVVFLEYGLFQNHSSLNSYEW